MKEFGSIPDQPIVSPQAATSHKPSLPADRRLCPACGEVRLVQAFRADASGQRSTVCKACAAKAPQLPRSAAVVDTPEQRGVSCVANPKQGNAGSGHSGRRLSAWVIVTPDGERFTTRATAMTLFGGDLLATGADGNLVGAWKASAWDQFWRVEVEVAQRAAEELTERQIAEIRENVGAGLSVAKVAKAYGVSAYHIPRIAMGHNPKRVTLKQADCQLSPQPATNSAPANTDALIRPSEVVARTSLSWRTVRRMVKDREFPQPVRISQQRIAFREREVSAWIDARSPVDGDLKATEATA